MSLIKNTKHSHGCKEGALILETTIYGQVSTICPSVLTKLIFNECRIVKDIQSKKMKQNYSYKHGQHFNCYIKKEKKISILFSSLLSMEFIFRNKISFLKKPSLLTKTKY